MQIIEKRFDNYLISTDKEKMDIVSIHFFLSNFSGWSQNIPLQRVETSVNNSLNFGLFHDKKQIGFARVISDFSTIAYLGDVYILPEHRGKGLSSRLMDTIMSHPDLQGLRRWILLTSTAGWLYKKYNFRRIPDPKIYFELYNPTVYQKES